MTFNSPFSKFNIFFLYLIYCNAGYLKVMVIVSMQDMQEFRHVRKHVIYYTASTHLFNQKPKERFSVTGFQKNHALRGQRSLKEQQACHGAQRLCFFLSHLIRTSERKTASVSALEQNIILFLLKYNSLLCLDRDE